MNKRVRPSAWKSVALVVCASGVLSGYLAGCGGKRGPELNSSAETREPNPKPQGGASGEMGLIQKEFAQIPGGATRKEVSMRTRRFGMDSGMVEYLFEGLEPDAKLTLDRLSQRIPTVGWTAQGKEIEFAELDSRLSQALAGSTAPARAGVARLMELADQKWAGGDDNKRLSQRELLGAGVALGLMITGNPEDGGLAKRLAMVGLKDAEVQKLAARKIDQQLLGRYEQIDTSKLAADDQRLEWSQLVLRLDLAKRGVPKRGLSDEQVPEMLERFGEKMPDNEDAVDQLRLLTAVYDRKEMGGDVNKRLSQAESVALMMDLRYARAVAAAQAQADYLGYYPKTGNALLVEDKSLAGKLKASSNEVLAEQMYLVSLEIVEQAFARFDKDADLFLTREEADAGVKELKLNPKDIASLFDDGPEAYCVDMHTRLHTALFTRKSEPAPSGQSTAQPGALPDDQTPVTR